MDEPGYGQPEQESPAEDAGEPAGAEMGEQGGGGMSQADGWSDPPLAGEPHGSVDPSVIATQGDSPITQALDC